ncbi:hypothetical protein [Cellulosimicrobium cellulans]|uniref:hypothetical protein n=1 Tax=Cellulosimicrobium cellulans TaxID=1710 RepID=UPI001112E986|nr:hypothetical protein [Cellulosimicrobium cellulans]
MIRGKGDEFSQFVDILRPRSLHQFLAVQAWTLHSQLPFRETWVHADDSSRRASIVHIPRDQSSADFDRRLSEAANRIAEVFDWSVSQLAEQVASVHADIFYIRVRSSDPDGTIPLRQASSTIDAIEKMVKSAAIITNNPNARGTGRTSERVSTFLNEDLRMGHTRRGSFIITVAARLQDRPTEPSVAHATPERVVEEQVFDEREGAPSFASNLDPIAPSEVDFTRRVMTTLSKSLDVTRRHLRRGDDFVELDVAQEHGMTVPIVEALEEISTEANSTGLDLKFEWSPVLGAEPDSPREVAFEPAEVDRLPITIERMKRRTEASDVAQVVGPVVSLSRDASDGRESGEVHVLADIEGATRKIGIDLAGVAYDWAIYAHRHHLPFSAEGVLGKVGNRWKIVDRLTVNTEFLQRYQSDRIERLTGERPKSSEGPVLD